MHCGFKMIQLAACKTVQYNNTTLHRTLELSAPRVCTYLDVRGPCITVRFIKEEPNKMQKCIKILLFHIYMKLNMFRATRRPSSGA
jgi:hypothetical protein